MLRKFGLPFVVAQLAILVIYSVFIFALGSKDAFSTGSFIFSYIFIFVFLALNGCGLFFCNKKEGHDKSINDAMYFFPAWIIAFLASLGLNLIFYFTQPAKMTLAVVLVITFLVIYIAYFALIFYVVLAQRKNREHVRRKVNFIRGVTAELDGCLDKAQDPVLRESLSKLRDDVRFSDPMSDDELKNIDDTLFSLGGEISDLVDEGKVDAACEKINQMSHLVKERNRKCKMLK